MHTSESDWFVNPPIIEHQGIGHFTSGDNTFESPFQIRLDAAKTSIETTDEEFSIRNPSSQEPFSFRGTLTDGRLISCNSLLHRRWVNGKYWFVPMGYVEIGLKRSEIFNAACFPILGLFECNVSMQDSEWHLAISGNKDDLRTLENTSEVWGIPLEGVTMQISHPKATSEQYFKKALEITPLLSLASGVNVTFNRQILEGKDGNTVEIWGRGTGGKLGLSPMLPSNWYQDYLKEAIPAWNNLSPKNQKLTRVAILYLNASAHGYMEDKILNVHIAWEMLANAWGISESTTSKEILTLKKKLRQAYKSWRIDHPSTDPNGFLFGRVSEALKWDKAIRKIKQLAREYDIDDKRIGTNFRHLKKLRDSIAHNGLMPEEVYSPDNNSPPYKLLQSTQFALRVLLLRKLGYTGLVASSKDNWRTFVDIEDPEFDA